eukprot:gene27806-49512_t
MLLGKVAKLLEKRFAQAVKQHIKQPAEAHAIATDASDGGLGAAVNPASWLMPFRQTMRTALLAELDMRLQPTTMKRYSFPIAFLLGALAVIWVAAAVATSHPLVLGMAAIIGGVYVFGAIELRQYRATTTALSQALTRIPTDLQNLNDWLITLPSGLHNPVRQRVEGERTGLPGPALTPYLVGLLVMLRMLGTFLGMVVTLNGA